MAEIIVNGNPIEVNQVAAEVARLKIVRYALDEASYLSQEDYGDGGHFAYTLAEKRPDGISEDLYSLREQTLYSLQGYIPSEVGSSNNPSPEDIESLVRNGEARSEAAKSGVSDRARQYAQIAARYALKRIRVIRHYGTEESVGDRTLAAYAYFRADIRQDLDRSVYECVDEIEEGAARAMTGMKKLIRKDGGDVRGFNQVSYYKFITMMESDASGMVDMGIGYRGTKLDLWWQELDNNIDSIVPLRTQR